MYLFPNVAEWDGDIEKKEEEIVETVTVRPTYLLVMQKMDWLSAQKYCQSKQAVIHHVAKKETIIEALSSTGSGLYRRRLLLCCRRKGFSHRPRSAVWELIPFAAV